MTARAMAGSALAALVGLAALAGCPGPSDENAPTVWLALDGRETDVKLIDNAPPPY